jgi:hypothetical protein
MALEISEIGVYVAIGEAGPAAPASGPSDPLDEDGGDRLTPARIEELVEACVHDVLRTLRMLGDR